MAKRFRAPEIDPHMTGRYASGCEGSARGRATRALPGKTPALPGKEVAHDRRNAR